MKQRYDCNFCSNCACKSHSKLPSIQQLIANGEQTDEHYFSNLPSRERKLLYTLLRNHEPYDNLRNRLVSVGGGSDQIRSEYKTPLYINKSCSSCNYCSYCSKPMINRSTKKYLVHPHYESEKYAMTRRKRFALRNLFAIRHIHPNPKKKYAEPCFCTSLLTYPSKTFFKKRALKEDRLGASGLNKSCTGLKSRPKKLSWDDKFQPNRSSASKKAPFSLRLKNQRDQASQNKYLDETNPYTAKEIPLGDEISVHVPGEFKPYEKLLKPVLSTIYLDKEPTQEGKIHSKKVLPLLRKNFRSTKRLNKNRCILKKDSMIPLEKKNDDIEIAQHEMTQASNFHGNSCKIEKLSNSKIIIPKKRTTLAHNKDLNFIFNECGSPIYLPRLSYASKKKERSCDIEQKNKISDPRFTRLAYAKASSSKVKFLRSPYFQLNATRKKTALTNYYQPIIKESQNSELDRKGSKRGYKLKIIDSFHSKNKEKRPTTSYTKSLYEFFAPIHNFSKSTRRSRNLEHLTTGKCASSICIPNICDSYYRFKKKQQRNNKRYRNRFISTENYKTSAISMTSSSNCKSRNTQTADSVVYNSKLKRTREGTESNNPHSLQAFRIRSNAGFNTDFYKHLFTSDMKGKVILAKCHTDSNLTSAKKRKRNKNKRHLSEHSTLQANTTDIMKCKSTSIGHILQIFSRPHIHKNKGKRMQRRSFLTTTGQINIPLKPVNIFTKINNLGQENEDDVTKSIPKTGRRNSEPKIVDLYNVYNNFNQHESMQTHSLRKQNRFETHGLKETVSFISQSGNRSKKSRHSAPNFRKQAAYQETKYNDFSDNRKEIKGHPHYNFNMKVSQKNKTGRYPTLKDYECEPGFCNPYQCDPVECLKRIKTRYKYSKQINTDVLKSNAVRSIRRESMQKSKIQKYMQTDTHSKLKVSLQPKRVNHFGSNVTLRKSGFLESKNLLEQTSKHNTPQSKHYSEKTKQQNNFLKIAPTSKRHYKKLHQKNNFPHDEDIGTGKYKFRKDSRIMLKNKPKDYVISSTTNKKKRRITSVEGPTAYHRENRMTMKNVPSKLLSSSSTNSAKLRNTRTNRSTRIARSHTIPRMPVELEKIPMKPPHRRVFTVGSNLHLCKQFYKEDNLDHAAFNANEGHSFSRSMLTQPRAPSSFVKALKSLGTLKIFKKSGEKEDKVLKTYHSNISTNEEVIKSQIKNNIFKNKKIKTRIKNKKSEVMLQSEIHKYDFSEVKSASLTKFIDKVSKSKGSLPHKASDSTHKLENKNIKPNSNGPFSISGTSQSRKSESRRNKQTSFNDNKSCIQRHFKSKTNKDNISKIHISTLAKERVSKHSYECEPHICVPGVCDPNVCLKIFNSKMKHFKNISVLAKANVKSKSEGTVSAFKRCFCLLTFKKEKNISKSLEATRQMVYEATNVVRDKKQDNELRRYFRKSDLKTKQTLLQENESSMETLMPYSNEKFKKSMRQIKIPDVYALMLNTNQQGSPFHVSDNHASVEHPGMNNVKNPTKLYKHQEKLKLNSKSSKDFGLLRKCDYNASVKHPEIYKSKDIKKLYKNPKKVKINSKSSKHNDLPHKRKRKKIDKHTVRISELNNQVDSKSSSHGNSDIYSNRRKHKKKKWQDERGVTGRPQDVYPDTLKTIDKINEVGPIDTSKCLQNFNAIKNSVRTGLINLPFGFLKILKCMKNDQQGIVTIQSKQLLQADTKLNFQYPQTVCLNTCPQSVPTAVRSICKSPQNVYDNVTCLKIKDNINRKSSIYIKQIKCKKNSTSTHTCSTTSQIKDKLALNVKLSVCECKKVNNNTKSPKFEDKKNIKLEPVPCCAKKHNQLKPECFVTRRKSVPGFFKCFYKKKNIPLAKQECPICLKNILFNVPPSTCGNSACGRTKCIKSESEIKRECNSKTREKENKNVSAKPCPLFDMIVDAKTMKVTNKDEIYRILRTNRCGLVAKQNLEKSSKNKMRSVIDLILDRDSANVLNCEQVHQALGTDYKRNKKKAYTLKNEMTVNQSCYQHLQKDKTPCQASINATPLNHSNHCTCCVCSNIAEVRKQHHPVNCTCSICRYGCRFGIKGGTIDVDKYGIKGRTIKGEKYGTESRTKLAKINKEIEKLIAQKDQEEERIKSQEPGIQVKSSIIATVSSSLQNFAKQLCVKPCYCGQKNCAKETEKLEQARNAKVPPPCVCGSTTCKKKYTRKTPYYKNKEEKKKMKAKKQNKRRKLLKKESLARIKIYAKKDAAVRKKIKRQDQKAMKDLDKYINHPEASSWALLAENASDVGRFGINTLSQTLTSLKRGICHPRDIHNRIKLARANPSAAAAKAWQNFRDSGFSGTVSRVRNRCTAMQTSKYLIAKVEANPITNYLFHFRNKDPNERLFQKKPEKEPEPYNCSPYLRSLRKKPCLWLYHLCPWFYPHCLSLLSFWRQFTDVVLFILAVGIWSPCILLTEFCRSIMCCFMCAGGV